MRIVIQNDNLTYISQKVHSMTEQAVLAAADEIVEVATASMEGQESPSAPGAAPAIVSGILHDSLRSVSSVSVGVGASVEAIAYTDVEYAQHLEFGTYLMEARPFLAPAAEKVRPNFEKAMRYLLSRRF